MGKLPEPPRPSSSQPCLLVAQTVSNRRKRHAQEQHYTQQNTKSRANPPLPPPPPPKMGGGGSTPHTSKKSSFQRSESFHQPQPHFFVNAQMTGNEVPPAPRVTSAMGGLATPSLSPISVVRNKRANQAHWEKQQSRKNSMVLDQNGSSDNGLDNCGPLAVTPILGAAAASCTRRQSMTDEDEEDDDQNTEDQMTEDSRAEDLTVPPPPSPPCTCGKNLELPPTPPLEDLEGKGTSKLQSFLVSTAVPFFAIETICVLLLSLRYILCS